MGRAKFLHKLADLMERDAEALAELEALDNGKSASLAKQVDLPDSIACLRYACVVLVYVSSDLMVSGLIWLNA